jgi:hypothetical protein
MILATDLRRVTALVLVISWTASCGGRTVGTGGESSSGASAAVGGDSDVEGATPSASAGSVIATPATSEAGASCNGGGCLCFSTPETCPTGCSRTHRADGTFVCGYACDGPNVPCNCVYSPDDGGIYVCDSLTMPACPAVTAGLCNASQGPCMTCGGVGGPVTCGCSDQGPFAGDAGPEWMCIGTEETCKGP